MTNKDVLYISFGVITLGVMLFAVGIVFEILELDDLWMGIISGPIVFSIGVILLLVQIFKSKKT